MKSIKTLTAIFILTLTFIATACAGNKDNKSVYSQKEQSDMEVIALTDTSANASKVRSVLFRL